MPGPNEIQYRITADDKPFNSAMQRVQATAKTGQERISRLGSAVSGLGFALGGTTGKAGQFVTEAANLAGVFATTGVFGLAIAGGTVLISQFAKKFGEAEEAAKKAREASKKAADAWRKELEGYEKRYFAAGASGAAAEVLGHSFEIQQKRKEAADLRGEVRRLEQEEREILASNQRRATQQGRLQVLQKEIPALREKVKAAEAEIQKEKVRISQVERIDAKESAIQEGRKKRDEAAKKGHEGVAKAIKARTKALEDFVDALEYAAQVQAGSDIQAFYSPQGRFERESSRWETVLGGMAGGFAADPVAEEARQLEERERLREKYFDAAEERRQREREHMIELRRLQTELGQTEVYWAEQAQGIALDTVHITAAGVHEYGRMVGEMQAALQAGDRDRYNELHELEQKHWLLVLNSVAEAVASRAIGEGSILVMKGIGEGLLGNPGGWPAAAMGAAMVAGGLAGTFTTGAAAGYLGAQTGAAGSQAQPMTTRAPTSDVGPGTSGGGGTTVIYNYNFGGPVFGNPDDGARAALQLVERGERLEGRRR